MATWGPGNFDSDGATEYLAELVNQFAVTVDEVLADEERCTLDGEGEFVVMPNVELIALLCERYDVSPPKVRRVQQWKKKYLKLYDAAGSTQAEELRTQRRQVIVKTFGWIESLAETYYEK